MNLETIDMVLQLSTILYFSGMAGYLLFLFKQQPVYQKTAFSLICSAVAVHFIYMVIYTITVKHPPMYNLSQNLSLAAFAVGCMFIFFIP